MLLNCSDLLSSGRRASIDSCFSILQVDDVLKEVSLHYLAWDGCLKVCMLDGMVSAIERRYVVGW